VADGGVPVVTPAQMGAIDAAAPEPTEVLIARAGAAVARGARRLLGGTYGTRVVVVAGGGNNGNDGRAAAGLLARQGARVTVIDAVDAPGVLPACDLVIDAAFGTGFRGTWQAPAPAAGPRPLVLAVDIVSGVDGLTGRVADGTVVLRADHTVTFAAYKPGLVLGDGPGLCGEVTVADIGLDTSTSTVTLVDDAWVAARWVPRPPDTHKWRSAVWVVAGSPGMVGAGALVCGAAARSGAGYVRLSVPAASVVDPAAGVPVEVVRTALGVDFGGEVVAGSDRFAAVVVGNGLGTDPALAAGVVQVATGAACPVVVDADGLRHLGADTVLDDSVVLTPHDAEFAAVAGYLPGPDRIAAARQLASRRGAVVLLKGPTTVVAHPDGTVALCRTGDQRLATAGTGDVLSGVIAGLCARGVVPFEAAAMGAYLHGRAADLGWSDGLVASDLVELLPAALAGGSGANRSGGGRSGPHRLPPRQRNRPPQHRFASFEEKPC
jgi:hydroxyethylthiazole kinase-like uncharacterized protein yjeF